MLTLFLLLLSACSAPGSSDNKAPAGTTGSRANNQSPAAPPAYMEQANSIIAGSRIGAIFLEMSTDSVIQLLGKPDRSDAAMGKSWLVWTAGHATHATHETAIFTARNMGVGKEESRVKEIRITSGFFHTEDSLHTGLNLEVIKAKLPFVSLVHDPSAKTSSSKQFYDDVQNGIAFEFDQSGICVAIIVHARNKKLTDIYLPLQS